MRTGNILQKYIKYIIVIPMNKEHYVYILKCSDNTYYTGYTTSLSRRFKQHQEGKAAKYTRGRRPVDLLYYERLENRSVGLKRENEIKALTRTEKDLLIKEGVNGDYSEKLPR